MECQCCMSMGYTRPRCILSQMLQVSLVVEHYGNQGGFNFLGSRRVLPAVTGGEYHAEGVVTGGRGGSTVGARLERLECSSAV